MTREFEKLFLWGGTPTATCGCGRTHYVSSGLFMDEGELEELEKAREENPYKYIPDHSSDAAALNAL